MKFSMLSQPPTFTPLSRTASPWPSTICVPFVRSGVDGESVMRSPLVQLDGGPGADRLPARARYRPGSGWRSDGGGSAAERARRHLRDREVQHLVDGSVSAEAADGRAAVERDPDAALAVDGEAVRK